MTDALLGPAEIRRLVAELGVRPTKTRGQNFVHDANTVRRIVRTAALGGGDVVLEVGPGLGSLTVGLLPACIHVVAVEIDEVLAGALPHTVARRIPEYADRLTVLAADAVHMTASSVARAPTALVANLPYNVAVPVVLHLLEAFPTLRRGLIMVQSEVADRLVAEPGSKVYGVPSVKLAWYASATAAGSVPRAVFWPVPNVDSALVAFSRREPPAIDGHTPLREEVFAVIDAAFAQRRKTLRSALASWAGSASAAEQVVRLAHVDPGVRGEALAIEDFARIVLARAASKEPQ